MDIIQLSNENIEKEHICCVMKDKKGACGMASKKAWLKERFADGLVFKKMDVRGKVFIEYLPADKAWAPVDADGYMFINCLWVAGSHKGKGYANALFEECVKDAKAQNLKGIVVISSKKKKPYISEKKFFIYKGFESCDTTPADYELLCLRFDNNALLPKFKSHAKEQMIDEREGVVVYYSHQCPYTQDYVDMVKKIAEEQKIAFQAIKYETCESARQAKVPSTNYSVFYNGKFVTNEILTEKSFMKKYEQFQTV